MQKGTKKIQPRRRRVQYPGIVADARALGVTRIHLWFVLTGKRESPSLVARYRHLQDTKKAGGAA